MVKALHRCTISHFPSFFPVYFVDTKAAPTTYLMDAVSSLCHIERASTTLDIYQMPLANQSGSNACTFRVPAYVRSLVLRGVRHQFGSVKKRRKPAAASTLQL